MINKFELPPDPVVAKQLITSEARNRERELESGALGRFFGNNPRVPTYIAGAIALAATAVGLIYTILPDSCKSLPTVEMWKIISPLILTLMAYIFGAGSRHSSKINKPDQE